MQTHVIVVGVSAAGFRLQNCIEFLHQSPKDDDDDGDVILFTNSERWLALSTISIIRIASASLHRNVQYKPATYIIVDNRKLYSRHAVAINEAMRKIFINRDVLQQILYCHCKPITWVALPLIDMNILATL
jgi:hypothetical protein